MSIAYRMFVERIATIQERPGTLLFKLNQFVFPLLPPVAASLPSTSEVVAQI
jgi:hypothetical protein